MSLFSSDVLFDQVTGAIAETWMIEVSAEYPQELILSFVGSHIGLNAKDFQPATTAAVMKDGRMVGGVVFNNYTVLSRGSWCEISVAFDETVAWTSKALGQIFEYPFKQLGVSRLRAETSIDNRRCRSILHRLGFKREGLSRRAYDGEKDSVVYSMLPDECRWLD